MKADDAAIEIGIALGYPEGGPKMTKKQVCMLRDLTEADFARGLALFRDVFQLKDGGSPIVVRYDPVDKVYLYTIAQSKEEAPEYAAKRAKTLKTQTIRLTRTIDASILKFGRDPVAEIHLRILQRQREGLEDLMEIAELDGGAEAE